MHELAVLWKDKKKRLNLIVLLFLVLFLPISLIVLKQTQIFAPKAIQSLIALGDGGCTVTLVSGKAVDCPTVPVVLTNPFTSTSGTSNSSPTPTPSISPTASVFPTSNSAFFYVTLPTQQLGVSDTYTIPIYARSDKDAAKEFLPYITFNPDVQEVTSIDAGASNVHLVQLSQQFFNASTGQSYTNTTGFDNPNGIIFLRATADSTITTTPQTPILIAKVNFKTKSAGRGSLIFKAISGIYSHYNDGTPFTNFITTPPETDWYYDIGSASSSPSPSPTGSVNCPTTASNPADLQTAVGCYRDGNVGGKITLSAGTFAMDKKISVPHDLTIAGAGINSTIITKSGSFGDDDSLMANDSAHGQQNIVLRDFTLQGDGQRNGNSCCYGLKLQNITGAYVVNVGSNNWGIDGIYLGQRPNKPGVDKVRLTDCVVNNNGRNGISVVDVSNSVIDHCQLSGNSTNELVSAIDLEPDNGNSVTNVHIFSNNISGNHNNGISLGQNPNDPGGNVSGNFVCDNSFGGNSGTDFADSGSGTSTSGCSAGDLNPPSASLPTSPHLSLLSPFHIATAYAQESTTSAVLYRLAENTDLLQQAQWQSLNQDPFITNFTLSSPTIGPRQIWAEFKDRKGNDKVDHLTFNLIDKAAHIGGVDCTLDLAQNNTKVVLHGSHFGASQGSGGLVLGYNLTVDDLNAQKHADVNLLDWKDDTVSFLFNQGTLTTNTNQQFKISLIRDDSSFSNITPCAVNTSLISLGAKVFCRNDGAMDASNVKVTVFYTVDNQIKSVNETVSIDKNGFLSGLKTKLQEGKDYVISVKAPNGLRRNASFTASTGTTVISADDGSDFILPVGDVAPANSPDGEINSADRAEIVRQWRSGISSDNTNTSTTQTADFNKDGRVNSLDWACMRFDFGGADDDLPTSIDSTTSDSTSDSNQTTSSSSQETPAPSSTRIYSIPAD